MGKPKEETENEKLQKDLEKKATTKFLDRVVIWMLATVFFFTAAWSLLNVFNITIQSEIIIGYFSFFSLEGGISAIITIKKNKKKQQENSYNDSMNYGYMQQPEQSKRHYQDEEEIYNKPEQPEDEGEIK